MTSSNDSRTQIMNGESSNHGNHNDDHDGTAVAEAKKLAKWIHRSADILLERLFSHLSQLPELQPISTTAIPDDEPIATLNGVEETSATLGGNSDGEAEEDQSCLLKRGMTLPVSAVVWLSNQLELLELVQRRQRQREERTSESSDHETDETEQSTSDHCDSHLFDTEPWIGTDAATSLRCRLNLLRFLLPRVQLIRLNRQPWPPPRSSSSSSKQRIKQWWNKKRRLQSGSENTNNISAQAKEFLKYARQFEGSGGSSCANCVQWQRVFPNATILILEGVPPSWIDLKGFNANTRIASKYQLRVIMVRKAAVYDLEDFLPVTIPSSSLSLSLTHLRLESCSLGELTKGFASTLSQLTGLEYLSLRNNEFRRAKTLLKALRTLTNLRFLDLGSNRLIGCFGPHANLCIGGQVRTLILSNNKLNTCRNSGLEKCFGLHELWLDSNQIQDVFEVSGLSGLPELQCLVLQKNPFSTKMKTSEIPLSSSPESPILISSSLARENANNRETTNVDGNINPFYDPSWKIRLWTWFQQERRATTPLELPLLKSRRVKKGFQTNHDTSTAGRMTREEWDQIQDASYSLATTSKSTRQDTMAMVGEALQTVESSACSFTSDTVQLETDSNRTQTEKSTATAVFTPTLLVPVRNRKVTKKSKTRKVNILVDNANRNEADDENDTGAATAISTPVSAAESFKRRKSTRSRQRANVKLGTNNIRGKQSLVSHKSETLKSEINNTSRESTLMESKEFFYSLLRGEDNKLSDTVVGTGPAIVVSNNGQSLSVQSTPQHLSFSLVDVLASLQQQQQDALSEHEKQSCEVDGFLDKPGGSEKTISSTSVFETEDIRTPPLLGKNTQFSSELLGQTEIVNPSAIVADDVIRTNPLNMEGEQNLCFPEHDHTAISEGENECASEVDCELAAKTQGEREVINSVPTEVNEDSNEAGSDDDKSETTDEASNIKNEPSTMHSSPKRSPRRSKLKASEPIDEDRIFWKPKVATVKLNRVNKYTFFDALNSDWDDVIKQASEGRITDGLVKPPILTTLQSSSELAIGTNNEEVFSEKAADLLLTSNDVAESTEKFDGAFVNPASASRSTSGPTTLDPSTSSNNQIINTLPEHVWQDDNSVLSSLGASRDDIVPRRINKFQLAEENSSYDGPDSSRGMKVVENLQLYFDTFVFPKYMPDIPVDVLEEMEEDENDWQLITMYHPRIQLWPDDQKIVERTQIASSMNNVHWTANRERFCRVWEEDIVPCGKPALRRLPPNRRIRLGFHGDKLFQDANVDAYSECRKVLLCLSTTALYVIPETDDVTRSHQKQATKRRFPLPLDRGDRFRDAPWPHAVARHPLGDLEGISIGFEFQRLTLRFRNTTLPKSDPFVYVLLTGDKRATVRICQEIQKLAKDFSDNEALIASSASVTRHKKPNAIAIENDSQIVMDSINNIIDNSREPTTIGTILHFQIVRQQWKHGDRGTVRRVFVITDTTMLLLDEDYAADGHDLSSVTIKGEHMADARYRLVDDTKISLVSQVQAASADPRAITIVIKASKLSRTHRWRLICRDREGAERLVEDARKALEL